MSVVHKDAPRQDAATLICRELMRFLPQRFPLLLVDRVVGYEAGRWIRGVKNVSTWEPMLVPAGASAYPTGLIVESIGQLAIALFNISKGFKNPPDILLGAVSEVVIERRISTGCRLEIHAELVRELDTGFVFAGEAAVDSALVVSVGSLIAIENKTTAAIVQPSAGAGV